MRAAYPGSQSIASLAREHDISRGAIRTAVSDLMPEHTAGHQDTPAPELPVTLDMPGEVADFLRAATLGQGVTVRRGQGYTLRVRAKPSVHRGLLACCQPLDGTPETPVAPAQRKVRRKYENRVNALLADIRR
ncbi:resolvase [Streptomyces triticisoli]|uniref:resolvase n=1 Tax=Streptomyces triticisoli TaxID=2182797 RepID=UPI000DD8657E|nr:resolvase [Streptomyces triticisoli]